MKDAEITFSPTEEQMLYVEKWLSEEECINGEGFYCNWNIIQKAVFQKKIAMSLVDNQPICFVVWSTDEITAKIDIAETHPKYRQKGMGRVLIEGLCERLARDGYLVVDLHCEPLNSERIWKRMGFLDFPTEFVNLNTPCYKHLYRILVAAAIPAISNDSSKNVIELWANEPHLVKKEEPTWAFYPIYDECSGVLEVPIIFPCLSDWRVRWRMGQDVLHDSKAKYFLGREAHFDKYLLIRHLVK